MMQGPAEVRQLGVQQEREKRQYGEEAFHYWIM